MTAALSFEWDSRDLTVWRSAAVDKALARALRNTGASVLRQLQKDTVHQVRERKALPEQRVRSGTTLVFPGRRDSISSLEWVEKISGKAIPLIDYGHTQGPGGVVVKVNATGGAKLIRSAFVARMRNGHEGIFKRRGKSRLPIDELFSSRLSNVIENPGVVPALYATAQAKFEAGYPKAMARQLKGLRLSGDL